MELKDLYQFVLLLVLVGLILGVGILALDKFRNSTGTTPIANTTLNNTVIEIGNIASDWLGLIVTVGILAIILTLVIRSFGVGNR